MLVKYSFSICGRSVIFLCEKRPHWIKYGLLHRKVILFLNLPAIIKTFASDLFAAIRSEYFRAFF